MAIIVKICDFLLHFLQHSQVSIWHKQTRLHLVNNITVAYWGLKSNPEHLSSPCLPTVLPNWSADVRGSVCYPFWVVLTSWLEVNHGGLCQVLGSLENSLHMTHFRYPQILRREKEDHMYKSLLQVKH